MKLPRPRFTLRWLMVAVAIIGITIGFEIGRKRRAKYLESAQHCADMERLVQGTAELYERFARGKRVQADLFRQTEANLVILAKLGVKPDSEIIRGDPLASEDEANQSDLAASKEREKMAYWARMKAKYERAARFPWLPIKPNPPILQ